LALTLTLTPPQEVSRREQEIAEKNHDLVETKRKNQIVRDSVQSQLKMRQMKLEELKTEHKCNETSTENVISSLTDKLAEVQHSLSTRVAAYAEEEDRFPSAPAAEGEEGEGGGLYPALEQQSSQATMPRSWQQVYQSPGQASDHLRCRAGNGS
jgi:hypothetical protein